MVFSSTLILIPADSRILRSAANENQERGNPLKALTGQNVSRQSVAGLEVGGIASEANALGKAKG